MEYILRASEMKDADSRTSSEFHISQAVLMERAAISAMCVLKFSEVPHERVLIVCGPGNNGGDGFALGRLTLERGIDTDLVFTGDRSKATDIENEQIESIKALFPEKEIYTAIPEDKEYTAIVDAIFGTGLNRQLDGDFEKAVSAINKMHSAGTYVASLDIPTGINADTGAVMGCAVYADITVTFAFKKLGTVLFPGTDHCGKLIKTDIGISEKALSQVPDIFAYNESDIKLPDRIQYSNKGTYGKILMIAGSENMSGAATLAASAAFRSGCGMVKIFTSEKNRVILQETLPEAIIVTYSEAEPVKGLDEALDWCDVAAIGPGISKSLTARTIVDHVLKNSPVPIVADADALNIISECPEMLSECAQDVIITPHIGEMSRLTGISIKEIESHMIETATDFAKGYDVICVMKDARSVIAAPDGRVCINLNGNNGMATAGSGDVLTGIIASLRAQGLESFKAASLGCAVHGKAGDSASAEVGRSALMAHDIINNIK